ncbi:hypothetical protein SKAU_G00273070 [Synaphobranchus kaupii]|uniref:Uncharacterized protein n=1 Tax=Synaphobranchus kaupii TaxID=118154 RepID=A0A9Q1INR8_SYNKA|nr:hypothetical protein SKAU_G00273070 [Synaphobranchus kaupii]
MRSVHLYPPTGAHVRPHGPGARAQSKVGRGHAADSRGPRRAPKRPAHFLSYIQSPCRLPAHLPFRQQVNIHYRRSPAPAGAQRALLTASKDSGASPPLAPPPPVRSEHP